MRTKILTDGMRLDLQKIGKILDLLKSKSGNPISFLWLLVLKRTHIQNTHVHL